jgi:hypothetical protein
MSTSSKILEKVYESERKVADLRKQMSVNPAKAPDIRRQMIERLYALAIRCAQIGLKVAAREHAAECIKMLKERGSETLGDCATQTIRIGDILVPGLLHEEVVKRDLAHYGVRMK